MLGVIIATFESERTLVPTLAALVSGATSGLITEVMIADGGSRDETGVVADVAGCNFMTVTGPLGGLLKAAAAATRPPWLLFLRPGTVLDPTWTSEVGHFIEKRQAADSAAVFRRGGARGPARRELASLIMTALGARPRPEQGLLIARSFYMKLGGHTERARDPEADLVRRIGRRRIVTLSTNAFDAS